jgi:hypothetical protein
MRDFRELRRISGSLARDLTGGEALCGGSNKAEAA